MTDAMDTLRKLMDKAGVDADAVEIEAEALDLDAIEREEILRDEAKRAEKAAAAATPTDDIPDPAGPSQLDLDDARLPDPDASRVGKWHGPDSGSPDTERGAAILQWPKSGADRRRVLDYLAGQGDGGATDEEVSVGLQMRLYTAAPRRNELVADGWVEDSGRRRPTATGAMAAVWILTERGRAQWRAAAS